MVSNAIDEGSKKVEISLSMNKITVEDWGQGIANLDNFIKYGEATKAQLGGGIIGKKGLGKLAALKLGKLVEYRTNNGRVGMVIRMDPQGFDADHDKAEECLPHQGTMIVVPTPDKVPNPEELSKYLQKCFGWYISKGTQIVVNDSNLKSRIDPNGKLLFRLKGGHDVTGNLRLREKGSGSIDLHIEHVYIRTMIIEPDRSFDGWVNCDGLEPATNRNDVNTETITYKEFQEKLQHHIITHFPKKSEEISRGEVEVIKHAADFLKDYLRRLGMFPEGKMLQARGPILTNDSLGKTPELAAEPLKPNKTEIKVPEYSKIHQSIPRSRPIERMEKTDYGLKWKYGDYSNTKEPVFWVPPNEMVLNVTNDLYRFVMSDKPTLAPKILKFMPFVARAAIRINPDSSKWDTERVNLEADVILRKWLKEQGYLH